MPQFYITAKAKDDLKNIAKYTYEHWGKNQRNDYLKRIDTAFHLIAENPSIGSKCDYIKKHYLKYTIGKHVIFYRQVNNLEIEMVRILHSSMDIPNYF
jgi:toxin ParE1/3/4